MTHSIRVNPRVPESFSKPGPRLRKLRLKSVAVQHFAYTTPIWSGDEDIDVAEWAPGRARVHCVSERWALKHDHVDALTVEDVGE
jgi:hypothetical protein